jgi:hypothetical protein
MKKIIDGRVYNTSTADFICDVSGRGGSVSRDDFYYERTGLFRTKKGTWFISGEGEGASRWRRFQFGGFSRGEGLETVTDEQAKQLIEEYSDAGVFEKYFETEEG